MKPSQKLSEAIEELDSNIESLVNLKDLPDVIHVSALREFLPLHSKKLKAIYKHYEGKEFGEE